MNILSVSILLLLMAIAAFMIVFWPLNKASKPMVALLVFSAAILALVAYLPSGKPGLAGYSHREITQNLDRQLRESHDTDRAQIEESILLLEKKLQSQPQDAKSWVVLGRAWALLSQPGEALFAYERGLEHVPDDDDLHKEHARALAFVNDPRALDLLAEILEEKGDDPDVLWTAAAFATNLGQLELALSYWQRLRDLLPPNSDERNTLNHYIDNLQANLDHLSSSDSPES